MFFLGRYVKTTANATVDHLSKYLALRVALEERRTDAEAEEEEEGGDGAAGGGEGSSLSSVSEKQYTIYILTRGGQFSVSTHTHTHACYTARHLMCFWLAPPSWELMLDIAG